MSLTLPTGSADALRQRNLSTVLRLVATHGPLSRADLARRTGLNRSTVGALVAELTEFGFVGETYPEMSQGMGRPSSIVSVNDRVVAVAVRPSVGSVTVAIVGLGGVIHRSIELPLGRTPSMPEAVSMSAAMIDGLRTDLSGSMRVVGIGAALPGLVQQSDGSVTSAPALGWLTEPFSAALADATGLPVLAANEAQLAVLAEAVFGAGRDVKDALYVSADAAGTAGGVIAAGAPLRGANGYAGDIGHMIVRVGGAPCDCGASGCLSSEIGLDRLRAALDADDVEDALGAPLTPSATAEVHRQLDLVASALVNAARVLDPEIVLLGGYLGALHDAAPEVLEAAFAPRFQIGRAVPIVRAGSDVDDAVLGASQLAFTELLNNPSQVAVRLSQLAEDSKHWSKQRLNPALFHRPQG